MAFAKLFETTEFGQILVKLGEHEDGGPEIRWFAEPPMLGICEFAVLYEDSDEGHRTAEEILSRSQKMTMGVGPFFALTANALWDWSLGLFVVSSIKIQFVAVGWA